MSRNKSLPEENLNSCSDCWPEEKSDAFGYLCGELPFHCWNLKDEVSITQSEVHFRKRWYLSSSGTWTCTGSSAVDPALASKRIALSIHATYRKPATELWFYSLVESEKLLHTIRMLTSAKRWIKDQEWLELYTLRLKCNAWFHARMNLEAVLGIAAITLRKSSTSTENRVKVITRAGVGSKNSASVLQKAFPISW